MTTYNNPSSAVILLPALLATALLGGGCGFFEAETSCQKGDLDCLKRKHQSTAEKECREHLDNEIKQKHASAQNVRYEDQIFTRAQWQNAQSKSGLVYTGKNLRVQTEDGSWETYNYSCQLDENTSNVASVRLTTPIAQPPIDDKDKKDPGTENDDTGKKCLPRSASPDRQNLSEVQFGDLKALISLADCSEGALVFLHGATGDRTNFDRLSAKLTAMNQYDFIYLRAPYKWDPPRGADVGNPGYLWFPINELYDQLKRWSQEKNTLKRLRLLLEIRIPSQYYTSLHSLAGTMKLISEAYDKTLMLGYSQGGMMAMHHVFKKELTSTSKLKALILLSTMPADPGGITKLLSSVRQYPDLSLLQVHTKNDLVIPQVASKGFFDLVLAPSFDDQKFISLPGDHYELLTSPGTQVNDWLKERF